MEGSEIHLLDVGRSQYGDCVLARIKDTWILFDGGHKKDIDGSISHHAIPTQLRAIMELPEDDVIAVDLLVVSHTHADHIGCLPEMVERGMLRATCALVTAPDLAWPPSATTDSHVTKDAGQLCALLREEYVDFVDQDAFDIAIADAASLQRRYRAMIEGLLDRGTQVFMHGEDDLSELESKFVEVGMKVLGPTNQSMKECARLLDEVGRDFVGDFHGVLADGGIDKLSLYKKIMKAWHDNLHVDGAFGPVVNMQSSIIAFDDGQHRFLFTGDSQLEKPEVPSKLVKNEALRIRSEISRMSAEQPFLFVKVGHHGSHNAVGPNVLRDLGSDTLYFGLCTGSESRHHPSSAFIEALTKHSDEVVLGRTDTNGRVSFYYKQGQVSIEQERGDLNDASVTEEPEDSISPSSAETPRQLSSPRERPTAPNAVFTPIPGKEPGPIEIKIPYNPSTGLNVSIQIKIDPTPMQHARAVLPCGFSLAGGRALPKLLFVTCSEALSRNIGENESSEILAEISSKGHTVVDLSSVEATDADQSIRLVQEALNASPGTQGVVLVGGYDVVPALKIDVFPDGEDEDERSSDADEYVVWTDNLYGDIDDDGMPELPVSRVPDGRSSALLKAALSAPRPHGRFRHGIHNVERPFATEVFKLVPGDGDTHASTPYSVSDGRRSTGDYLYFMLHGRHEDATRFWGENEDGETIEALHLNDLELSPGAVVFTGCCWGALPVVETALDHVEGPPTPRTAGDSIALACLNQGALAYIGCTGVHYSPKHPPYDVAGGGIHKVFWRQVAKDIAPSAALLAAKKAMASQMEEHSRQGQAQAMNLKLVHQFCLLGLGW